MLLVLDIGNTSTTLGIFDDEKLIQTFRFDSDINYSQKSYETKLESLFKDYDIDSCAIVSVVDELSSILKNACDNVFSVKTKLFSHYNDFDLKIGIQSPETIGADRLANAVAAKTYGLPAIVIDIGTAVTFDIVSRDGEFLGGIIMPGINLQFKALNQHTSKLPLLEPSISSRAIGNCTNNAILSGVLRGTASAIDGLIKQCEAELKESAVIIATGGQCNIISEYMTRKFDIINLNLTLEGLKQAYLISHVNLY